MVIIFARKIILFTNQKDITAEQLQGNILWCLCSQSFCTLGNTAEFLRIGVCVKRIKIYALLLLRSQGIDAAVKCIVADL